MVNTSRGLPSQAHCEKTSFTPPRGAEPSKSATLSSKGVRVSHLRGPYNGLSTNCESLKLACSHWKAIWTETTPAVLRQKRGHRVYETGNGKQARGQWREWSSQRETLCLANFFLPLGKLSSSKPLPVKVTVEADPALPLHAIATHTSYK